jgi:hypothetical protein
MRRAPLALLAWLIGQAPLSAEEPRDAVERAVAALGGKDVLSRPTARKMKFQLAAPTGGVLMTGELLVQPPDRSKTTAKVKVADTETEVVQVRAGKKGWASGFGEGQIMDLTEEQLTAQAAAAHAERVGALVPLLNDKGFTLTGLPEEQVEGRPAVGVKAAYKGQPDVSIWFDKENGLPVKVSYSVMPGPLLPVTLVEHFMSNYRDPDDGAAEEKALAAAGVKIEAAAVRAFLHERAPGPEALQKAREAAKKLADESFEVREQAVADLLKLGPASVAPLEAAARDADLEVSRRARACLEQIKARLGTPATLAAVRWLGLKAPAGAAEALLELADGADALVTAEIKAALYALTQRPGGPPAALTAALADRSAARRAVAAAALGRDGGASLKEPGRRLYLPGLKQPMKITMRYDLGIPAVFEISEVSYYNRFDDKEFEKPKE